MLLTSCISKDDKITEEATQQSQVVVAQQDFEQTEEPEFIIEADYDPSLVEKAPDTQNKIEATLPIALTADDDDLAADNNDLPTNVKTNAIRAYDYKEESFLDDTENTIKGQSTEPVVLQKESGNAIYFVVAGAFRDKKVAQKKADTIIGLGYKAELITFDENFKTVCVAKLENRSQADLLAKALQAEKIDAYVVKRRK